MQNWSINQLLKHEGGNKTTSDSIISPDFWLLKNLKLFAKDINEHLSSKIQFTKEVKLQSQIRFPHYKNLTH